MEWKHLHAYFVRTFEAVRRGGVTQTKIARAGGTSQNQISKILKMVPEKSPLGPSVTSFVRAVEGMGIPASTFFAEFEKEYPNPRLADPTQPLAPPPVPAVDLSGDDQVERAIGRMVLQALRIAQAEVARPDLRRRPK